MRIYLIILTAIVSFYYLLMATITDTKNTMSAIIYNFIPALLGIGSVVAFFHFIGLF